MKKRMSKADYRAALLDSWGFVKSECVRLGITPTRMSTGTDLPISTMVSYFNGRRQSPGTSHLNCMVEYILRVRGELDES